MTVIVRFVSNLHQAPKEDKTDRCDQKFDHDSLFWFVSICQSTTKKARQIVISNFLRIENSKTLMLNRQNTPEPCYECQGCQSFVN